MLIAIPILLYQGKGILAINFEKGHKKRGLPQWKTSTSSQSNGVKQ
jgi:hypothetical protein